MRERVKKEIALGEKVTTELDGTVLTLQGPKGKTSRNFMHPKIKITVEPTKVIVHADKATKREKTVLNSFAAHIHNMVRGVQELHVYKLKICSGHFPISVTVAGNEIIIKNFLGESVPRRAAIFPAVEVKVSGAEITVSSSDKEVAGQMAARIEQMCRITNRDVRTFQDGCHITEKAGKAVA